MIIIYTMLSGLEMVHTSLIVHYIGVIVITIIIMILPWNIRQSVSIYINYLWSITNKNNNYIYIVQ